MPLGIDPTVDFVFKKLFGDPANSDLLIHLLNSVLQSSAKVVEVEILNPFVPKDFEDDKLAILDIKAKDETGRWFNVEMQTSVPAGLPERLMYYTSCLYSDQLQEGQQFTDIKGAVSICFLSAVMFPNVKAAHQTFVMTDQNTGVVLTNHFQVHTVELAKYTLNAKTISTATDLEKWVFFLTRAAELEASELKLLLNGAEYSKATRIVEMISRTPDERHAHDSRVRARRDYLSDIEWARRQGIEAGVAEGIERGIETGIETGIERGIEKGERIGSIRVLQQFLDEAISPEAELRKLDIIDLKQLEAALQLKFAQRRNT